ncbi:hypothetical protein ABIG07_002315 [Bradyrhizobium ottawaense]|uniref:Uncharacterized protein n=1 Tax=Bradyrhizobium ottawaense TaxID=931866 RepID=A0ABV4FPR2_9BRAD
MMATTKKLRISKKVSRGRRKKFAPGFGTVNGELPAYSRARCRASLSFSLSPSHRGILGLDALLDVAPLRFQMFRSFVVLPLRGVQRSLRLRDRLLAPSRSCSRAASSLRRSASRRLCSRSNCAAALRGSLTLMLGAVRRLGSGRRLFFGLVGPAGRRARQTARSIRPAASTPRRASPWPPRRRPDRRSPWQSLGGKRLLPAPHASSAAFMDGAAIARSRTRARSGRSSACAPWASTLRGANPRSRPAMLPARGGLRRNRPATALLR